MKVAVRIAEPALADRIVAALSLIDDFELVGSGDVADVAIVLHPNAVRRVEHDVQLTLREIEVLQLLAEGASNKLIARRLDISMHTAKYHVSSLLDKLDAVSRTDAVALAARFGMLNL